jgi:hypothetical protein
MANVNTLLNERLKKGDQSSKMAAMARQSADGQLTSFSGIFSIAELSDQEKDYLEALLNEYATGNEDLQPDLRHLISITSEVKAINNQAALLHGERIKKARDILIKYRDGAFTSWLIAAYGNRQTPYNFLQYYEFCEALPKALRPRIDVMPRQAVYTLASREGPLEKKQRIIESYNGETKAEVLRVIRETFPLAAKDRRRQDLGEGLIQGLSRICASLNNKDITLTKRQKNSIDQLLENLHELIHQND